MVEDRRRDGATLTYAYDNLNRVTSVTPSANGPTTTYAYDNFSRTLTAAAAGRTLTYTYDQLSRVLSEAQPQGTVSYQWDLAGRRTQLSYPGGLDIQYEYDLTDAITSIEEEGTTSLATYAYDALGRRTGVARGNGTGESATFDGASRLTDLTQDLLSTGDDLTLEFTRDAAGRIVSRDGSNSAYDWSPVTPVVTNYADNGLNQYSAVAGASQSYDTRGNLTTGSYGYDIFNRLITGPSSATLLLRARLKEHNKSVAQAAKTAGVTNFANFNGAGLKGLYGGLNQAQVLKRKGLPEGANHLDYAGHEELAANYFKATQAEAKLRREVAAKGEIGQKASDAIYKTVGGAVRKTIADLGGTAMEDVAAEDHIKEAQKRVKAANAPALPAPAKKAAAKKSAPKKQ